ncbi:uncharacterized protein LOC143583944 [Bidens hawaiensis]|uniref:uncharacterized protein LOC143583944 n=1 Tax=Bidens hawaiensis TaxID=980011 RepID=UPI00404B22C7
MFLCKSNFSLSPGFGVSQNVNVVCQKLQSKDMIIDDATDQVKKLINYFKKYREVGLSKAINEAKEIAIELGVDPIFNQRRLIRRKKQFGETSNAEDVLFSAEEDFRVNYFFCIVDQAISSIEKRFEQYQQYEKLFGFLFPKKLREIGEKDLKSCFYSLQDALKNGEEYD